MTNWPILLSRINALAMAVVSFLPASESVIRSFSADNTATGSQPSVMSPLVQCGSYDGVTTVSLPTT